MKKFIFIFLSIFFTFQISSFAKENEKKVSIYFFWGKGCPHCKKEKKFLDKLNKKYPDVQIYRFEVWENKKNDELLKKVGKKLNIKVLSIPVTFVGDKYFIGFLDENTTGKNIETALIDAMEYGSFDVVKSVMDDKNEKVIEEDKKYQIPDSIKIPFFGQIKIKNISLPLLTIILGAIDGFNPCAMWALLMLISFLIAVQNRKKMFFLGFLFIFASAFIYFLFMVAWLNFLLFFAYVKWIKIA
ncbi:MAG: hypothetical protein KR126chlam6_00431, partial [Candidatus Anoxychlamydiales bacterium]|nr:hypothetical protein [Candidatus Anoxychlamydiales bacterium]